MARDILILLGPPGAGKGTQASAVTDQMGIPQIATGDMLRNAALKETPMGLAAKKAMDAGNLVSDEVVHGIVRERIVASDCQEGFILDGYPRTVRQAEMLQSELFESDRLTVIELVVDSEFLINRIISRVSCSNCNAIYNVETRTPTAHGICDRCGQGLVHRSDDRIEILNERLKNYEMQTEPLANFYKRSDVYFQVSGMDPIDQVTKNLTSMIRVAEVREV